MDIANINHFLDLYGIAHATSFEVLPRTTSGNVSYLVATDSESYVIRTLVRQSLASAEDEYAIQVQLNDAGITTPIYLQTIDGKTVASLNSVPAVISKRIVGSRQQEDTLALARNMGSMLAKIHTTLHNVQLRPNEQQWFNPKNTQIQLERYTGPDKAFITAKTSEYAQIYNKNLPCAITHGDFHTNNIFSEHDHVTAMFDFESAEYSVRILDIARTYLTYRKVTTLPPDDILDAILGGYNETIPYGLTDDERTELLNAFIYVALLSSVSIFNHGNEFSSAKYLEIAKLLLESQLT